MLLLDFSERGEECLRLAEVTASRRDRDFLVELARAWYGLKEQDRPPDGTPLAH